MKFSSEVQHGTFRALLVPGALLVQASIMPSFSLFGVQPSLFLAAFVLFAFRSGPLASIWMGFACGLTLDTYSNGVMGAFALALALVGFFVGQLHERRVHVGYPLRVTILGLATVFHDAIWHLASHHGIFHLPLFLLRLSLPSALYTMLLGAVLFAIRPAKNQARNW